MEAVLPSLSRDIPIVLYVDEHREFGGLAVYAIEFAGALRRLGYQVIAICHANETVTRLRDGLRDRGVVLHVMDDFELSLIGRIRRIWALRNIVRRYEGCVLVAMMGYMYYGTVITVAGALAPARAVIRFDSQHPLSVSLRDSMVARLKTLLVDRVVVGSREDKQLYTRQLRLPERKVEIIHTGIDLRRFQSGAGRSRIRASLGFAPAHVIVGTASRLTEDRKGVNFFLKMAARLAPRFPNLRFVVVGDGWLRPLLEQQATTLGIAERCVFTGWRNDLPELLAAMDIFVMPSLSESGPTIVLEAMAMGKAVIATRVGMVPEVIEDGTNGLIVEVGDAIALADALNTLLVNQSLRDRIGAFARETAERSFSVDHMAERYLQVFQQAIVERPLHARRSSETKEDRDEHLSADG